MNENNYNFNTLVWYFNINFLAYPAYYFTVLVFLPLYNNYDLSTEFVIDVWNEAHRYLNNFGAFAR